MVQIGLVVGTFGLDGWLKVEPLTDFPERFDPGSRIWLGESEYRVQASRWHRSQVRINLRGIDHIDQAEALRGRYLEIEESARPRLGEREFYVTDLLGLLVLDESGKELGPLEAVIDSPAHDLLQVGDILIPFVGEFVREVDRQAGRITVRLLPGMLED
ncbi:MAG TPA: ribosome maturation factor RimM [Fimbriimonadaceae bacterium]|nr:ribosome maturation factor RimM [Fimbriimonadaceae bacterium]HRJ95220.1 ribosome maturation factor RimM [Fimbriimonadaceae bacterium]